MERSMSKVKAFWKKTPELERITRHIGKVVDRLSFDDIIALSLGAWGYIHTQHPIGFPLGLLGYKLALARNTASGAAGLAMLGFTGLIGITEEQRRAVQQFFMPKTQNLPEWWPRSGQKFMLP